MFTAPVSSYSNPYTQPRSSPNRCEYNPAIYSQWMHSGNAVATSPALTSFGYYETHADGRYATQEYYPTYPSSSRPSATSADTPVAGSRKLPPLNTSSPSGNRDERWNSTSYQQSAYGQVPGNADIRSSSASSYPNAYPYTSTTTSSSAFSYDVPLTDMRGQQIPQTFTPAQTTTSSQMSHPSYTPPPVSPTIGSEEPTIKKKRKRADAQQLKILNETYARTPFPSTEDRLALAKLLDMSARSVQIWFQNKRQSMRQTRQSSSNTLSHQGYALSAQPDLLGEDPIRSGYETSGGHAHVPRSQDPHLSPALSSSHRRHTTRPQESAVAIEGRKWPGRGY
ncbi:hypothetical protein E1B28_000730 [Marasmius oreades]|uniref:Homeobox domain-containing protein n=1 Tax=Marasmius oreades TaxID=181124 RepID=A0A9P7V1W4_9AGAR|nr:uncharacterized protein E1B28_000730 [Marasmius oreades]KAG7098826.1 hypothetical protein E1B28_000730 [Marasmius oreades]